MIKLKGLYEGYTNWNQLARVLDKALKKVIVPKGGVPLSYAKDYVQSLERMAKRNPKQFFKDYGDMSVEDFIEDVEYNLANE